MIIIVTKTLKTSPSFTSVFLSIISLPSCSSLPTSYTFSTTILQEFRRSFLGFPDGTINIDDLLEPASTLQRMQPCSSPHSNGEAGIGEQKSGKMDLDGREIDDQGIDGRVTDDFKSSTQSKSPGKELYLISEYFDFESTVLFFYLF